MSTTSWISGISPMRSWIQQGNASYSILSTNRTNDTLRTELTGLYVLGVPIEVENVTIPVGFSFTETWTCNIIFQ